MPDGALNILFRSRTYRAHVGGYLSPNMNVFFRRGDRVGRSLLERLGVRRYDIDRSVTFMKWRRVALSLVGGWVQHDTHPERRVRS